MPIENGGTSLTQVDMDQAGLVEDILREAAESLRSLGLEVYRIKNDDFSCDFAIQNPTGTDLAGYWKKVTEIKKRIQLNTANKNNSSYLSSIP